MTLDEWEAQQRSKAAGSDTLHSAHRPAARATFAASTTVLHRELPDPCDCLGVICALQSWMAASSKSQHRPLLICTDS